MKNLSPFAVRTKNLTEDQLVELFVIAEEAGAILVEGTERMSVQAGVYDIDVFGKDEFKFAGVDCYNRTVLFDNLINFIGHDLVGYSFQLFSSFENACAYLISIIESKKEEDKVVPLSSFKNTKLYTQDKEIIEKYAKLCGAEYNKEISPDRAGVYFKAQFEDFAHKSMIDDGYALGGDPMEEVTPEQVEKAYAEKVGCEPKEVITRVDLGVGTGDWGNITEIKSIPLELKETLEQQKRDCTILPEPPESKLEYQNIGEKEILKVNGQTVYYRAGSGTSITIPDGYGDDFTLSYIKDILIKCRELNG